MGWLVEEDRLILPWSWMSVVYEDDFDEGGKKKCRAIAQIARIPLASRERNTVCFSMAAVRVPWLDWADNTGESSLCGVDAETAFRDLALPELSSSSTGHLDGVGLNVLGKHRRMVGRTSVVLRLTRVRIRNIGQAVAFVEHRGSLLGNGGIALGSFRRSLSQRRGLGLLCRRAVRRETENQRQRDQDEGDL